MDHQQAEIEKRLAEAAVAKIHAIIEVAKLDVLLQEAKKKVDEATIMKKRADDAMHKLLNPLPS